MKIRSKIFLFVLPLAILPLILIGVFTYRSMQLAFEEQSYLDDQQICNVAASNVERLLTDCNDAVLTLRSLVIQEFEKSNSKNFSSLLREEQSSVKKITQMFALRYSPHVRISFLSPIGKELFSGARIDEEQSAGSAFNDTYFLHAISIDGQFPASASLAGGHPITSFIYRVQDGIRLKGFIRLDLDIAAFTSILDDQAASNAGHYFLFDGAGNTITESGKTLSIVSGIDSALYLQRVLSIRSDVSSEFLHKRTRIGSGQYSLNTRPVKEYIAYKLPVPEERWYLGLIRAETPLIAAFRLSQIVFVLVLLLCVVLALVGAMYISKKFTQPIAELTGVANEFAKGKLEAKSSISTRDEIGELASALNTMATNIKDLIHERQSNEALVTIGRTSSALAHDMKNPIEGLKLLTREMQRHAPQEGIQFEIATTIEQSVGRLSTLIRDTLDFTRLRTSSFEKTDLVNLVEEAMRDFDFHLIKMEKRFERNLPHADVDPTQIRRMLSNLIRNAYEASLEQTDTGKRRIEISVHTIDRSVQIDIADSGKGIDHKIREKIFEPFFTTKAGGHGLGLAYVRQIIANHHGTLSVHRTGASGTTFSISLPITQHG